MQSDGTIIETLTPENLTASTFIEKYEETYRASLEEYGSENLNPADKYILKQSAYIQAAIEHIAKTKDKSPVERRLDELDLITLYTLCVDEALQLQGDNREEQIKFAEDLLRENRASTKEVEVVNLDKSPIVIGLEAEGDTPHMPRPRILTSASVEPMEKILHKSGLGTFKIEPYGANEYAMSPAASIDTLGRELQIIMQARSSFMRQADILGMHENISGVEITKENTQMLALYAMQIAAKQIKPVILYGKFDEEGRRHLEQNPVPDSVKKLREEITKKRLFVTEGVWKTTQTPDGKFYKIPSHRMKYPDERDVRITAYPHKEKPAKSILERRTSIIITAETYSDYMKELATTYKASTYIASAQKSNAEKTSLDNEQSAKWQSTYNAWINLLDKYNLAQPDLSQCIMGPYATIQKLVDDTAKNSPNPFDVFINNLLLKIADEPEFANEAKKILDQLCEEG